MPFAQRISLALGAVLFLVTTWVAAASLYNAPRWQLSVAWEEAGWTVKKAELPLRTGDRLLRIQNKPLGEKSLLVDNMYIGSRSEFFAWLEEKAELYPAFLGTQVEVTVARDGQELNLRVPLSHGSWSLLRNSALMHWPVALVFFVVGWITYLRPKAGSQAFWFYLMCLSMSLVYLTNATSLMATPILEPRVFAAMNLLNQANFVLAPALLFHFALLLPRKRSQPWLGLFLVLTYVMSAFVILTLSIPSMGVLVPLLFLGSLLAIGQGAWSYRGVIDRQQMKWVGVGFLLGVGPWFLVNGVSLLLTGDRLMSDTLPGACLAFIPVFMGVAVHRYRLFDVGTFLEGTLAYLATVSLLAVLELTVLTAAGADLAVSELYLLGLALFVGLYGPLRARLGRLLARLFHRTEPSEPEVLEVLRREVSLDATPEGVFQGLTRTVETLWAPSEMSSGEVESRAPGAYLRLDEQPSVDLVFSDRQAVRCGPLPQGRFYTSRVVGQLDLLARQCALYHQSAILFRQADLERQQRLEERERLLGDLHDGVGSALASIRMLSQESRISELARDALFELQNVLYDSPDYRVGRASFVAELRVYCQRLLEDTAIEFEFSSDGGLEGELSRPTALSLFRLLKEGMANAMKHSGCSKIRLEMTFGQDLQLSLSDNGVGIKGGSVGRGMGGMKARVESLGGEFTVRSEGVGVHLQVRLPL